MSYTPQEVKQLIKFRKVALQNLNIDITKKFEEELERNINLAHLFTTKEFLREIININDETITRIASQYGIDKNSIPPLFLQKRGKGFLLGLATEKEQMEDEYKKSLEKEKQAKKEGLSKIAISLDLDLQSQFPVNKLLLKKSFSPQEVEDIKFQALTATDTKDRIKAIRTSMYTPIPNKDKIFILTKALLEEEAKIKLESLGFLKYFGIRPQVSEIFKEFISQKPAERKLALDTLLARVEELESIETTVLVILLLSFLKFEDNDKLVNSGLQLAEKLSSKIVSNLEWTLALLRIIIEKLSESFFVFSDNSYKLLKTLLHNSNAEIQNIIFGELDTIPNKNIKGLFLDAFCNVTTLSEKITSKLPQKIFDELLYWDEMQFECRRLGNCFTKFGIDTLNLIVKNFNLIPQAQKQFFIRLITPTFKTLPASAKLEKFFATKFFKFLTNLISKSTKQEFITFLEEGLILNVPVPDARKINLLRDILIRAGEFMNERINELILILFSKLDINVIDILYKIYTQSFDTNIKKVILRILTNTRNKYDYTKNRKSVDKFLKMLEGDYAFYSELKEDVLNALGALLSINNVDSKKIENFALFLKKELPKSKIPWAIIQAFTYLVTSPATPLPVILDIAHLLINIVHTPVPDIRMDELKTKDTTVYKIYSSVRIFTDLLPAAVICLEKIALHPKITNPTRVGILKNLLEKYEALINFKEVWGPQSVSTLIKSIKNIVISPYCPLNTQLETLKLFAKSPLTVNICEAVCDILNMVELTQATNYYFEFYILKILEHTQLLKNAGDYETIYYIIKYLIKLLNRKQLSINKSRDVFLREKIISTLVRYHNEQIFTIYPLLVEVSKMPNIPPHIMKIVKSKITS